MRYETPVFVVLRCTGHTPNKTASNATPSSQENDELDSPDAHKRILPMAVPKASAVLFDLRMLHRGGANVSKKQRPMLYMAYVKVQMPLPVLLLPPLSLLFILPMLNRSC